MDRLAKAIVTEFDLNPASAGQARDIFMQILDLLRPFSILERDVYEDLRDGIKSASLLNRLSIMENSISSLSVNEAARLKLFIASVRNSTKFDGYLVEFLYDWSEMSGICCDKLNQILIRKTSLKE